MKKLIFIVILLMATSCLADTIQIPFSCYPKEIQKKFAATGRKLDLTGNDRDVNSWGFIDNKGTHYDIVTYNQISVNELKEIQKIVMEK